jgi:hypothetical protein
MGVAASPPGHQPTASEPHGSSRSGVPDALLALAERCEKAEGRDCDLDHAIHDLLGDNDGAPLYTASVDEALTLLPTSEMALIDLTLSWEPPEPGVWPACSVTWYPPHKSGPDWHAISASGRTPALALCAAALQARAAQADGRRMAETGTGSGRSPTSAVAEGHAPKDTRHDH